MLKKIVVVALMATFVTGLTSCREDKSTVEKVADDIEDAVD
ncbi:MAG: hypothetical protein NWQ09_03430 [Nonlabens sp.]|jgi:hypothetical protein|nr:hypothetical protein [Nonlabens sp.]